MAFFWLILNLRVYLKGFWKRGIRPKTRKNSQKVAGRKYEESAFTISALTMAAAYASVRTKPGVTSDTAPWIVVRHSQERLWWVGSRRSTISNEVPHDLNKQKSAYRLQNVLCGIPGFLEQKAGEPVRFPRFGECSEGSVPSYPILRVKERMRRPRAATRHGPRLAAARSCRQPSRQPRSCRPVRTRLWQLPRWQRRTWR